MVSNDFELLTVAGAPSLLFKRRIMIADGLVAVGIFISMGSSLTRPDVMMILVYLAFYPYLSFTDRRHCIKYLIIASLVAMGWYFIAKSNYGYNHVMIHVAGYTLFPLFAWAVGLFYSFLIYYHLINFGQTALTTIHPTFIIPLYWILLFFSEFVAYHYFNLHNIATVNSPGLPLLDILHVPLWMKLAYLMNGPIYLSLCESIVWSDLLQFSLRAFPF